MNDDMSGIWLAASFALAVCDEKNQLVMMIASTSH